VPQLTWRPRFGRRHPSDPATGIRVILSDPAVRIIIGVVFVTMLGFGIVAPVLPLFARSFGVSYGAVGLLISAFAFTRLVVGPVTGLLVDRFGERASAATGVAIVGVSSLLTGLAPTFTLAVTFRGAGGAGSALLFTALTSYLIKVVPKDRMGRTLGLFYGSFNVGIIAGAPVGGVIASRLGLASPLFFYAGLLFVAGVLYLWLVRDPAVGSKSNRGVLQEGKAAPSGQPSLRDLLVQRAFITTITLNFAYLWMVAAVFETLVPLFGRDGLGMEPGSIGAVFSVALAVELVVLYPAGKTADRIGRRPVVIPSMAALAVLVAVLGFASNPLVLGGLMALLGIASGYAGVPPGAMLSDVTPAGRSGTAVSIFRFAGDLGFTLAPVIVGSAASMGFRSAFWVAAVPVALALILALQMPETLTRPGLVAPSANEDGTA
jgi:MFS transporter, DHA1 family, multidrug resistance protein